MTTPSAFNFDELVTPVTPDEAETTYYQVLGALGVTTTQWQPGSVVRTYITSTAIHVAALSEVMAAISRSGFLELSSGEWLRQVAHYVYGIDYLPATFASGVVTLTNSGGGLYVLAPGDLICLNPTTKKTYRNTSPITLNPLSVLTNVPILAEEVGTDSSSAAHAISQLVTTLLGVAVDNPLSVVGRDAETNEELRSRCYAMLGSLSPLGPWDAYRYAAVNATRPDGSNVGVTRTQNQKDGYGNQTTFVATRSGGVPGLVSNPTSDLGIVDYEIQHKAAPLCVTAHTSSAITIPTPVTYEAWMYSTASFTAAEAQALISTALDDLFSANPIGGALLVATDTTGFLFRDAIIAAIKGAIPEIYHVTLSAPASDVALVIGRVATRTTTTPTIHIVAPPEGFGG
jgi:hypothetical protein